MKTLRAMTVAELRAALAEMPADLPVGFEFQSGDYTRTVLIGCVRDVSVGSAEWSAYHDGWRVGDSDDDDGWRVGDSDDDNPVPVVVLS